MCVSSLCDFVYHIRCSSTSHNYERVSVRACVYVEKHLSASVLFQCRAKLNICGLGMEVGGLGGNEGGKRGGEGVLVSCSQVREL